MKQVLILEDTELTRNKLTRIVESIDIEVDVHAFSDMEKALGCALTHHIDLYLVDIVLCPETRSDFSGIRFVEKIKECPSCAHGEVVFITSLAGLETELLHRVHCYDYIEKPIDEDRVKRIVEEVLTKGERATKLSERIYFRSDGIVYPLDVGEIRYVSHQNRKLYVYTGDDCLEIPNLPLKRFLDNIQGYVFLKAMKGVAVNIAYIKSVDYVNQYIHLKGIDEPIAMGSVVKNQFREEYESYMERGY